MRSCTDSKVLDLPLDLLHLRLDLVEPLLCGLNVAAVLSFLGFGRGDGFSDGDERSLRGMQT
jgi:hypothetical protein